MKQSEMDQWPCIVDDYLKKVNNISSEVCQIDKDLCYYKRQTAGLVVMIYGCGIVLNYDEMIRSESISSVSNILINSNKLIGNNLQFAVYDNGCHLGTSVENLEHDEHISNMKFVIDRFHQYNHKRPICKTKYSCDLYPELDELNSEICEQKFRHLRLFKSITKHMGRFHFEFFYLCLFSYLNENSKEWFKPKNNKKI